LRKKRLINEVGHNSTPENTMKSDFTKWVDAELELTSKCNDIILSFLFRKYSGTGRIDDLFLKENNILLTLNEFLEKQNVTEFGYVEIIKQTDKYYKLKINDNGRDYLLNHSKNIYRIKSVTLIKRISLYVLNLIRKLKSFVFVSANNRIKTIMESGYMKLIGFFIVIFSLILKWEDIIKLFKKLTE
jgi:hypothetical protein